MTSGAELLPCPFCGGRVTAEVRPINYKRRSVWIICPTKGCAMALAEHRSVHEAITAWNTRALATGEGASDARS